MIEAQSLRISSYTCEGTPKDAKALNASLNAESVSLLRNRDTRKLDECVIGLKHDMEGHRPLRLETKERARYNILNGPRRSASTMDKSRGPHRLVRAQIPLWMRRNQSNDPQQVFHVVFS